MTLRAWIITMRGRIREALCPELQVLRDNHATLLDNASIEVRRLRAEALKLEAERDEARAKYYDLVMSVGNKYPGESRHETAKRYIHQAERMIRNQASAALKERNDE